MSERAGPGAAVTSPAVVLASLVCTLLLFVPGLPAQTATGVEPGDRLDVQNFSGRLLVRAWEESRVVLRSDDADDGVRLVRSEGRVALETAGRVGRREVDGEVRVPRGMPLRIRGGELDVEVEGVEGAMEVRVIEGDLTFRNTGGELRARTVDGEIHVREARGVLVLSAQSDDVRVVGLRGPSLEVESGDGDVVLEDVDVDRLHAETLDGDVTFAGVLRPEGRYRITIHDGDATVVIPRGAGVRGRVATFDGEFVTDLPVTVRRYEGGRSFDFEVGDGRAELEIQLFDGEIRLVRDAPRGGSGPDG